MSSLIEGVKDEQWYLVFPYLRRFDVAYLLNPGQKAVANNCINNVTEENLGKKEKVIILCSLEINDFRKKALEKIESFSVDVSNSLLEEVHNEESFSTENLIELVEKSKKDAITGWINSSSFGTSKKYGERLLLVSKFLDAEDLSRILTAFCENDQICGAEKFLPEIMTDIFKQTSEFATELKETWLRVRDSIERRRNYDSLKKLIDSTFL